MEKGIQAEQPNIQTAQHHTYADGQTRWGRGCISVATDTIQVLGDNGYIKDCPAERYLQDTRITSLYEGTNQLTEGKPDTLIVDKCSRQ